MQKLVVLTGTALIEEDTSEDTSGIPWHMAGAGASLEIVSKIYNYINIIIINLMIIFSLIFPTID